MRKNKILYVFVFLLVFTACKTKQTAVKPPAPPVAPVSKENTITDKIKLLQMYQPAFHTANAGKMQIDVNFKGREMTVGGTCQMVTDSAIHLSIMPFMGIELFKLELTRERFVVIDKMNKKFYENTYAYFKNHLGIPIDFDGIQSFISNRLFLAGKKAYLDEDFAWKNNTPVSNTLIGKTENINEEISVDNSMNRIVKTLLQSISNHYTMNAEYGDFKLFGQVYFPSTIDIKAMSGNELKGNFKFTIEKLKFNEPVKMKSANLDRYTRGDMNTFLKK